MAKCVLFLLLDVLCIAVGVAVPAHPNKELGQALAASVSESLQTMKALENQGLGGDASFRQDMMQTLLSKQEGEDAAFQRDYQNLCIVATFVPVLNNPELNKVAEHANSVAQQSLPEDAVCVRDWSRRCPDGWEDTEPTGCSAPASYKGGCKRIQLFDAIGDQRKKSRFASVCSAPWACAGSDECISGMNYDSCPLGWVSVGRGFCSQTPGSSKCALGVSNFVDMPVGEKQVLARQCGLVWPCRISCERDYSAKCPEDWQTESNLCVAPAAYAGDCSYSVDTADMSNEQKEAWASGCGVRWQCATPGFDGKPKVEAGAQKLEDGPLHQSFQFGRSSKVEIGLPKAWLPSGPIDGDGGVSM